MAAEGVEPPAIPPVPSLAGAAFLRGQPLAKVVSAIEDAGGGARVVGGAVRNALIGRDVGDLDIATTLSPDEVIAAARARHIKAVPTGFDHGTVTLVADGTPLEVTSLRRDVETDGRRAVVAFTKDWATDAQRRDFTVNALYADLDGTLHDHVGGVADLLKRRIRFIGDAETRIREDYLRILRFFRFHAEIESGEPDGDALRACRQLAEGLARVSRERMRYELLRLLGAPGAVDAVEAMQENGILEAVGLGGAAPDRLANLASVEERLDARPDPMLRLAALMLDASFPPTALAETLRLSNQERDRLANLAASEGRISRASAVRDLCAFAYRHGKPALLDAVKFTWAGRGKAGDDEWLKVWRIAARLRIPEFPLSGRDLLEAGASPGPELGKALTALETEWIEHDFAPGKAELLRSFNEGATRSATHEGGETA